MTISLVAPNSIDAVWPSVRDHLEKAFKYGIHDHTLPSLYVFCRSGRGFLFTDETRSAALILSFDLKRDGQVAEVVIFGGEPGVNWPEWIESVSQFARVNGALKLVTYGRKGFQKLIPNARFSHAYYEMDLG